MKKKRTTKQIVIFLYEFHGDIRSRFLEYQKGKCAICKRQDGSFVLDHHHKSGIVRAVLCRPCNGLVGLIEASTWTLKQVRAFARQRNVGEIKERLQCIDLAHKYVCDFENALAKLLPTHNGFSVSPFIYPWNTRVSS